MKKILFLTLFITFLISVPCYAKWVKTDTNQYGTSFYFNSDMFYAPNSEQTKVNIWTRIEINQQDPLAKNNPGVKTWVTLACINLKTKEIAPLFHIYYDHNGGILKTLKGDTIRFETITPNSSGDLMYHAASKLHKEHRIP